MPLIHSVMVVVAVVAEAALIMAVTIARMAEVVIMVVAAVGDGVGFQPTAPTVLGPTGGGGGKIVQYPAVHTLNPVM